MNGTTTSVLMEEVKKNIRALLISAPRGLSVDDIEHDYRAMLGKPMPFKQFKCSNCFEFLKTIPDVVSPSWINGSLILRGIADSSTRHIAKLVSRQKVPRSRSRRVYKPPICTKPLVVPSYFRSNIKELLTVYPKGVLGSALNVAYSRHYGEEINYAKLGFRSMSHLLDSIRDIVTIVKDGKGGFRVCATAVRGKISSQAVRQLSVTSKPPAAAATKNVRRNSIPNRNCTTDLTSLESNDVDKKNETNVEKVKNLLDSKSGGVSEDLKEDLIAVLAKRPNGIWAARLPFEYKALLNKELSILSLGFYSIIELASSLPDVFRIERPFGNSDWLLFLSEKSRKDKNMTKIHLPENGVGKGGCYCQLTMPKTDINDVFVTYIKNPGCFWVQLITHYDQLTELENEIREFYKSKQSAEFLMVDCLVKIGQICAARFPVDNLWYRALITATPAPTMVEVFYVDYGNSSQVAKSDLRLLKKEFIQLPAQALKSKLANIKPKSMGKWDPAAAHRLNDLTFNKALYSIVCDTKVKDEVLSLCICDTTSKVDVHVNDVLVEEGFAVLVKQAANESVSSPVLASLGEPTALNLTNQQFPEYSMPYNLYNDISGYGMVPMANGPLTGQLLSSAPEESLPRFEEAKPSTEDLEFMRQVCEELSDEGKSSISGSNTVKRLELPEDKFIHLINYQGKPYVVRSEVSALLWESDLLRSMLRKKNMVVPKEVIAREDHDELFNELKRQKVGDFDDVDDVKEFASLYELSTIPRILEAFKHPSAELVQKVKEEKVIFDANPATYWIEKDEGNNSSETDSCKSEPEEELELEELKLALQALQFRRKRILRAMMKGDLAQGENTVDEVDEVEKQIASIHDLITRTEEKDGKGKDTEGTKDNKDTEDTKDKEDIQGEGTMSNKETKGKKENVSSTVQQDSKEVQEEIKTSKNNELPALKDPSPTTKQSAPIPNEEKPTERMPHKQDKPIDSQEHFLNLIDQISGEKNPPASGQPKHDFLRVYSKKPEEYPSRSSPQNLNHVTAPRQTTPTLFGLPPFLPPHRVNIVHRPNLPFPPTNANHGLPPQPVQFSSFNPRFHPVAPSFADITLPPAAPYHAQGFVGQQPIPPFFFPWGQNSFGSGAITGETIYHNRPGW